MGPNLLKNNLALAKYSLLFRTGSVYSPVGCVVQWDNV